MRVTTCRFLIVTLGLMLLGAIASAQTVGETAAPLTAEQIMQKMGAVYDACNNYHDTGLVSTTSIMGGMKDTSEKKFATSFVRPDKFRFECLDKDMLGKNCTYIIWHQGEKTQVWWDLQPGVETPGSFNEGMGGMMGACGSFTDNVPSLLFPEDVYFGSKLSRADNPKLLGVEKVGTADCYKIQCEFAYSPKTLWIDKASFLLRKTYDADDMGGMKMMITVTYQPVINGTITDAMLQFRPAQVK